MNNSLEENNSEKPDSGDWVTIRTHATSELLDNPYENGIYRTSDFFDKIDYAHYAELKSLQEQNERLKAALKNIVDDWDRRMMGDIEKFTQEKNGMPSYWSPSASMINSQFISEARKALNQ